MHILYTEFRQLSTHVVPGYLQNPAYATAHVAVDVYITSR